MQSHLLWLLSTISTKHWGTRCKNSQVYYLPTRFSSHPNHLSGYEVCKIHHESHSLDSSKEEHDCQGRVYQPSCTQRPFHQPRIQLCVFINQGKFSVCSVQTHTFRCISSIQRRATTLGKVHEASPSSLREDLQVERRKTLFHPILVHSLFWLRPGWTCLLPTLISSAPFVWRSKLSLNRSSLLLANTNSVLIVFYGNATLKCREQLP